jgi:hypothetical protein
MEKTNFLASLAERQMSTEENFVALTVAVVTDNTLMDFFFKSAVAEAFFTSGGTLTPETVDTGVLTSLTLKAIMTAAEKTDHAATAYQDFLERGDDAIVEGVANAHLMGMIKTFFSAGTRKAN